MGVGGGGAQPDPRLVLTGASAWAHELPLALLLCRAYNSEVLR